MSRLLTLDGPVLQLHRQTHQCAFLDIGVSKFKNLLQRLEDISYECLKHEKSAFKVLHYVPGTYFRVHSDLLPPIDVSRIVQMMVIYPPENKPMNKNLTIFC